MEGATHVLLLLLLLVLTPCHAEDCNKGETYVRTGEVQEVTRAEAEEQEVTINLFLKAERKNSFKGVRLDIEGGSGANFTAFFKTDVCFKLDSRWKQLLAWGRVDEEKHQVSFAVEVGSCAMSCAVDGLNASLASFNLSVVAYGSSGWFNRLPSSCRVLYLSSSSSNPDELPACLPPPDESEPSLVFLICVVTILCFLSLLFMVAALYCRFYATNK
ncbi:uncharacterized protein LOC135093913 [Scylla paramamosain]|uniref:uncharacterized protein LOC135093913 n=1 Tax=Scylla paramamosain TaxID=85552 RepID=UPI003082C55C